MCEHLLKHGDGKSYDTNIELELSPGNENDEPKYKETEIARQKYTINWINT